LWRWAIDSIYSDIRRKYFCETWEGIQRRRDDKVFVFAFLFCLLFFFFVFHLECVY
jgi:hypothetical protein